MSNETDDNNCKKAAAIIVAISQMKLPTIDNASGTTLVRVLSVEIFDTISKTETDGENGENGENGDNED